MAPLASCNAQQGSPAQTPAGEVEKKESQIDRKTKVEEATKANFNSLLQRQLHPYGIYQVQEKGTKELRGKKKKKKLANQDNPGNEEIEVFNCPGRVIRAYL